MDEILQDVQVPMKKTWQNFTCLNNKIIFTCTIGLGFTFCLLFYYSAINSHFELELNIKDPAKGKCSICPHLPLKKYFQSNNASQRLLGLTQPWPF